MSIQVLRDGPLSTRRNERTASLRRRASKLRTLNAVTAALTQHVGLPASLHADFNKDTPTSANTEEAQFLDEHDLEKGHHFQDSTLLLTFEHFKGAFTQSLAFAKDSLSSRNDPPVQIPDSFALQPAPRTEPSAVPSSGNKSAATNAPSVLEKDVSTRELRQDLAQQDDGLQNAVAAPGPGRSAHEPAKSIGVVPAKIESAIGPPTPNAVKPVPANEDQQSLTLDIGPQKQKSKDAHDSLLSAQKEAARLSALGEDLASPDDQIRREEEQAAMANRDAPSAPKGPMDPSNITVIPRDSNVKPTNTKIIQPPPPPAMLEKQTPTKVDQAIPEPKQFQTPMEAPARMRTRVSSGVLRHKSVSEIISESPKNAPYNTPRLHHEPSSLDIATPKSVTHPRARPETIAPQNIFKQQEPVTEPIQADRPTTLPAVIGGYAALKGAAEDPSKDYLEPLYRIQAQDPPNGKPLAELLHRATKAVSTSDQFACVHERQDHRILKRIYALQYTNHWSLRQMDPVPEPPTPKSHMDYLLEEMKWMRTDFRQERKAKRALAKFLAQQCADWVSADATERTEMQIQIKMKAVQKEIIETQQVEAEVPHSPAATNGGNIESHAPNDDGLPELESSKPEENSPAEDNDMPSTPQYAFVPGSFFSSTNITEASLHMLDSDDLTKAISELPLYTPFGDPDDSGNAQELRPKSNTVVPAVSKFCNGKIIAKVPTPSKKRSRYDYEDEDDIIIGPDEKRPKASEDGSGVAPEQTDVALFHPENKHIKDRLHANTAFRPPSEFAMPSTQFYEFRSSSQWTHEDDQLLRQLAKDFSFNWSLIADRVSLPSMLHGAAERRTPWECFERWVELETLPNEMKKTVYFRTWAQRMDNANRNVDARFQAQLQVHSQNPTAGQPPSRRRTQPARVEKRRANRYLHLVDSMRKLARKREQQQHKQAEAQKAASLRKQQENAPPKSNMHTPQEFSRLRHERDVQLQARAERYREQLNQQNIKALQLQRSGQYPNHPQAMAAAGAMMQQAQQQQQQQQAQQQQQRPGVPNAQQPQQAAQMQNASHAPANVGGQPHGQAQPQQGMAAPRGGHLAVPQMGGQNNIPQAQMQATMRGTNTPQSQAATEAMQRMAMQAQFKNPQMQQQSQQYQVSQQQQQQQQQHNQQNHTQQAILSPGGQQQTPNGMMNNQMHNNNQQAMTAGMQTGQNGSQTNTGTMQHQQNHNNHVNNNMNTSASPHMPPPATPTAPPQQLSSGHIPAINQIKHNLQAQNPAMTTSQIDVLANEQIKRQVQAAQARQNAINAASGSHGVISGANNYNQNQAAYQQNQTQNQNQAATNAHQNLNNINNNTASNYNNNNNAASGSPAPTQAQAQSQAQSQAQPQHQQNTQSYSQQMRQRIIQQQAQLQQNGTTNGSPQMQRASPNMMHVSPNMQQAVPNMNGMNVNGQLPQSRSATPQMVRVPSSGGMRSPGVQQGSPRANMIRPQGQ